MITEATITLRIPVKVRIAAVVTALALLVSGCNLTSDRKDPKVDQDQTIQELEQRPNLDQALASYEQLLTQIREGITGKNWAAAEPPELNGCNDFSQDITAARTSTTTTWVLSSGISDELWPTAVANTTKLAKPAGFTTTETVVDRPGDHEIAIQGPYGSVLHLSTLEVATLYIETGCHLTPDSA